MKTPKLDLEDSEKYLLKKAGITLPEITSYAPDELCIILKTTEQRAREINALVNFQNIPSIGPKFARDLIALGYYSLNQLKDKNGAELFDAHQQFIGTKTDPCVEDQFRLVVYYANNPGSNKQWWDFTSERKAYRGGSS
ncbi:helix-hairpin-helix domain-containing protein [Mucilaginibacter paludis]|uniref:Pathogenicity locus n=1 Tax=Mucilaginibacter paludis DSM 18603 TaxID=714943 RepID=H1Y3D5_9SPHI|nr:helix-hairpin-helix domain-containing protein [Mucilaginibacter paludis]EHQ29290.1 hypothetical protein Mucpa_5215 [Mucilaginibacter paludis DSM 18603]